MYYKRNNIGPGLKEKILDLYAQGIPTQEIALLTGASVNAQAYLFKKEGLPLIPEDIASFNTNAESILIIADTHIGNKDECLPYIDEAYNVGVREGVGCCLHLGDIIQGNFTPGDKTIDYQLETLDKVYPEPNEFDTYLLLGNHDYVIFENVPWTKQVLESKKGLHTLGYRRAYFNWCNYLFSMDHKIRQIEDDISVNDVAAFFVGHGHEVKIRNERSLKAGTLSNNIINKTNGAYPSFFIAHLYNDRLYVDVYDFDNNKAKVRKKNYFKRKLEDIEKVK